MSEEGHAGGKFPRPDLHERLDRALPKTKPDLVFACYGMNDGIYLPLDEARASGAIGLFADRYGDEVSVYKIGDVSMEFCGGPHVSRTSEIGRFQIKKEQSSSAGVRRIRAQIS